MKNNETSPTVPFIVYESSMASAERKEKRLWILCITIFMSFIISNGLWFYYESQFEDYSQEVTQEAEYGTNNFVGGDFYGEADS